MEYEDNKSNRFFNYFAKEVNQLNLVLELSNFAYEFFGKKGFHFFKDTLYLSGYGLQQQNRFE